MKQNLGHANTPHRARKLVALTACGFAALALLGSSAQAAPHLEPEKTRALKRWEVVSFALSAEDGAPIGKAIAAIAQPPEVVLHTIIDVGAYQHFLPRVKGSRLVRKTSRYGFGVVETSLPWPVRDAWAYFKFAHYAHSGRVYEMRWKMINGTMKYYDGSILIEPWNESKTHSVVTIKLRAQPKTSAPSSLLKRGARRVAEIFLHRLRMRIKALVKYKKIPADVIERYR